MALGPFHLTHLHVLCLRTSVPLSAPEPVGLNALRVGHPATGPVDRQRFSLTAVRFGPESTDTKAGMTPAELRSYVGTVFLAAGPGGAPISRTLLGRRVQGETFTSSIPRPQRGEIYDLRLGDGSTVVLGFAMPVEARAEGEALIAEVAASLRTWSSSDPSCGGNGLRGGALRGSGPAGTAEPALAPVP